MLINDIASRIVGYVVGNCRKRGTKSVYVSHARLVVRSGLTPMCQQIPNTGSSAFILDRTFDLIRGRTKAPLKVLGELQALYLGISASYKSVIVLRIWLRICRWLCCWFNGSRDGACSDRAHHVPERGECIGSEISAGIGCGLCGGVEA